MSFKTVAAIWSLAGALACAPAISDAQDKRVFAPGSTVPLNGIAFGGIGDSATPVTAATPFPVTCIAGCSATGAGVATASAPTRAEGQASGLSFDLNGALRVVGGGGGGGGPVTVADGADLAMGAKIDSPWSGTGSGSSIAILKSIRNLLATPLAVTGTFWQATQPVSAVSLPLPAGASSAANQATGNASLAAIDTDLGAAADPSCATDAGSCSALALLKRQNERLTALLTSTDPAPIALPAAATGAVYRSATSNNSTLVATGARTLYAIPSIINTTATVYYLRLYNGAAAPTCSSGTGEVFSFPIPADATGAGVAPDLGPIGVAFSLGLGFCLTSGGGASDNTSAAPGVTFTLVYK